MQASSTNVVYLHKEYNKHTQERMKIIKFLERLKDMVELVYGYKKNNPLLKDMHVYPEEMKVVVGYWMYRIIYVEEDRGFNLGTGWDLEYKTFGYFTDNIHGLVDKTTSYYVLDYLLEDVAEKVQAGLNDLPEKLPYYSTTSRKHLY